MEKLVKIMLNEGIDEDTIVNVVEALLDEADTVSKEASLLAKANSIIKNSKNENEIKAAKEIVDQIKNSKHESLSESCFNDIISLVESFINEYIKQSKMNQLNTK